MNANRLGTRGPLLRTVWAALLTAIAFFAGSVRAAPLTTIDYRVTGQSLQITPAALAVPKNIAGSVATAVPGELPTGSFVEAFLRGPSFPARRLVGLPNAPLLLPPLNLVGDYSLDGIRLAAADGATLLEGVPASVPVRVFDEVLVSRVTSRPLTLEEIQGLGIVIDDSNFRVIEFEVGFVIDGATVPVSFPVIAPNFSQTTEIVPAAELEARLAEAERLNEELAGGVVLPPELETAQLNVSIQGINFQAVDDEGEDLELRIPPIPALMVIPGNIGFLNQFFSVMIFTENGSPANSGLSVREVTATLKLPPGPDQTPGTFAQPGDDPIRFARTGPNAEIHPVLPVHGLGADGELSTSDDVDRLQPGETGQVEFLVEGLQEGLHIMDLDLTAKLDGLAAGTVEVKGKAAGSVLVRNPKFSMAFSHPRTVRAGEPYEAFVTILNTSTTVANLVNVELNRNSVSGGVLDSAERVELGTLLPGQTGTASFRIISQRTGSITFSNLTTSDDSLIGRFRLRTGVDERGVTLSPDTIVLPDFVEDLPPELVAAAQRVLGQALSTATAGQVPPGVIKVSKSYLKQKGLELAEAGQRVRYGDALELERVLPDLLLDWQGGRAFSEGWDQLMRETNAGQEWREALMRAMEDANPATDDPVARLVQRGRDIAGRGESWCLAAVSGGIFQNAPGFVRGTSELNLIKTEDQRAGVERSSLKKAIGYGGREGAVLASGEPGTFEWRFGEALPGQTQLSVLKVTSDGTARELLWRLNDLPAGSCATFDAAGTGSGLLVDDTCDGVPDRTVAGQQTPFTELPPSVRSVVQDPSVFVGRPPTSCFPIVAQNYANVLAVLFSKPMTQASANVPSAYQFEDGNPGVSVQVQPGGRVALVTMRRPFGQIVARSLSVGGAVTDVRGNPLATAPVHVNSDLINGAKSTQGAQIRGRVVKADGSFAAGVPVTLTYNDEQETLFGCQPWIRRVAQVFTDAEGQFTFDYVLSGIPFSVSATDTSGLSTEAIAAIFAATQGDALIRDQLEALAAAPGVANTLLAEFAAGSLPQAIARAEGLDRALVRDSINAARVGTEAVYALRFRGRGTVDGQVLAADGVTPVSGAAVNLFPDPDSRELGRGLLSDSDGRFAFFGVPLGVFSVEATAPSGQSRVVADVITSPGETKQLSVILSQTVPVLTSLQGRVTEPDGTPHGGASVFIGRYDLNTGRYCCVIATATADSEGFWTASNVPVDVYDPLAISLDGRRKGDRRSIQAAAGSVNTVNIVLQGRTTVTGRVENDLGEPVPNALVGGGEALVSTDNLGRFTLTGVPTGPRTIPAALERDPANGIDFPRLGSGSVNVISGAENFVIVRLIPAGSISGRVFDANGNAVPNSSVAIPQQGGFMWVNTDAEGDYEFIGLPLGKYTVSSPAPPHEDPFNAGAAISALTSGDQQQMLAAIGEAFAAFTGVNNPLLNGDGANFSPLAWGFEKDIIISFDGDPQRADIHYLGLSTVSGIVKNGQGVPIGARVRLTGVGPSLTGAPTIVIRGERNSDPALGTFEFRQQALMGDWGLQAASPFFPVVIARSGRTNSAEPDAIGVELIFPPARENNGSLSGRVFLPDGSPAGANVAVEIGENSGRIHLTDAEGRFATQQGTFPLIAGGYLITADDPATGFQGQATAIVTAAQNNEVDITLLGKGSADVLVTEADGTPVAGAVVDLLGGAFPTENHTATTNAQGVARFGNITSGPYAACANFTTPTARIAGRSGLFVQRNTTATATIVLQATGNISGRFVEDDRITPIAFANIALSSLGFATTRADGTFDILDVPLGTYRLVGTNAVTGRTGSTTVTLSSANQELDVLLVETALGEVFGSVINGTGDGTVANAKVELRHVDPFVPVRTVTTGPDGGFRFPGTPAGVLSLTATDPVTGLTGSVNATLTESATQLQVNIGITPQAALTVRVREPGGATPASATVRLNTGVSVDTDAQGEARFTGLPLGNYVVTAISRSAGATRSFQTGTVTLASQGGGETITLTLRGNGAVQGQVFLGDGTTPAAGAEVAMDVSADGGPFAGLHEPSIADPEGRFTFTDLPLATIRLSATNQALGASANVTLITNGLTITQNLTLSASGTVMGRLVRADASTIVPGVDVLFTFTSQSGLPGRANVRTGGDGRFSVSLIPVGSFNVEAISAGLGGIARRTAALSSNGQTLDLGDLVLDEDFPEVVRSIPADTAQAVDINTNIEFTFNEALKAASIDPTGVFVRKASGGPAIAAVLTQPVPDKLLLDPVQPLESETTYQIVVVDGDLLGATGGITNRGPRDLVDRPLTVLFSAIFTTRDQRPPVLLSFTPENGAEEVDTSTPVRLTFDEPIRDDAQIVLTGSAGAVPGTTSLGLNGLSLVFLPSTLLPANGVFTATVSNVRDIAGNELINQPRTSTFATLDTVGPVITALRLKNNQTPVAGAQVTLEVVLAAPEVDARVRFFVNRVVQGTTAANVLEFPFTLPGTGSVVFGAIAIDRFGREGEIEELNVTVLENTPPVITFTRLNPVSGPVPNGGVFAVRASVTDDGGVTDFRAAATGAATATLQSNATGAPLVLQGVVPLAAVPGTNITFVASATDNSGLGSGQQSLDIPVSDGTAPAVTIATPAANSVATTTQPFVIGVDTTDNSGDVTLQVALSGTVTGTQLASVDGVPNVPKRTNVSFDLSAAPATGGNFTATATATDGAGRTAQTTRTFRLPDTVPPALEFVSPANGATDASVATTVLARFSEPLDPATVSPATVTLTTNGSAVAGSVSLSGGDRDIRFVPAAALTLQSVYTFSLSAAIRGADGNAITPVTSTFTVSTNFAITAPAAGSKVIEGQRVVFTSGPPDAGFDTVTYIAAGGDLGAGIAPDFSAALTIPPLTELGAAPHLFGGRAVVNGTNLAIGKTASQSSTGFGGPPGLAIDGNTNGAFFAGSVTHTNGDLHAWWEVDLGAVQDVATIRIFWRTDCCAERNRVAVLLAETPFNNADFSAPALPATYSNSAREVYRTTAAFDQNTTGIPVTGRARFVRIAHLETNFLSLAEVQVLASGTSLTMAPIVLNVRPGNGDEDGDGMSNAAELANSLDPFVDDSALDPDNDGRSNLQEVLAGTSPNDSDSDDDGLNDGAEFTASSNPLVPDTDGDGLKDGIEPALGSNPVLADTDGDTLSDGLEAGIGRLSSVPGSFTWLEAKADAENRSGHLLTITSAQENSAMLAVLPTVGSTGFWIGLTDRFIEGQFRWVTGEISSFTNFNPGEPNNSGDEDFVHFNSADARWNDHNAGNRTGYVLETGFFTSPALADTDGDGTRDDADTFPGQANRPPVAVADEAAGSPDAPILLAAGDLLNDDSDPDGDPFVIVSIGTPANGTASLENNGGQVRYVPNTGFSGPDSFTYTVLDAGGLTATGTVNITIGTNHPPVAGTLQGGGFALQFDGTDDFLQIGAAVAPELDQFSAWTIEAWVRPTAFNNVSFPVIYSMGFWRASLGLNANNGSFDNWINDANPVNSLNAPALGEWTHVALTFDGTNRRFFVNGVESGVFASGIPTSDGHPTRIGAAGAASPHGGSFFRGTMDEVRVWSTARSPADIASRRFTRLTGVEDGLAAYWPLEEGTGTVTADITGLGADASFGNGVAAAAPAWVPASSPVAVSRQNFSVIIDTVTPLALDGSDVDGNPLTARILSLPANGRLFQAAAGGGLGAEITLVPVTVASASRVVFYQPDTGFTGPDSFEFSVHDGTDESAPAIAALNVLNTIAPVTGDPWDVSSGTTVTGTSGFRSDSPPENIFGASSGVEPGNGIFADGRPAGFTHFIEWESTAFLRLEGARLFASDDGAAAGGQRGFTEMRLFGRLNATDPFTLLSTFRPGQNPYFNNVRTILNFSPFVGKQFRAEFDQFGSFFFGGPRIGELDAIGETVVMIPTPAEITLQNATSDRSQGGFTPVQLIDGIVVGGQHGWAGDVGGTPPMTAVFETEQSIGATANTEFTFGMPQPFGGEHFIGCFRLSATTDSRNEFADGLINGGDVTANWTILDPVEITTTGGETVTILPDKSILIGGNMPATTTYTVKAKGITGAVTGFRLELLEHPSLPNNGPGRVGHGNWVLAEFTVAHSGGPPVANRAPQPQPDVAQTPQGIPVTTGNVLANDSDPEGDSISLVDFTQPAAGTGTVAANGDGNFTYTPPNGTFTGTASFTYRITDDHQNSGPTTVTITVLPSPERVWTNAAGGNWNTAANWLGGNIPGPDDVAVIDLNGTYTVTLDTSPTVSQIRLGGSSGNQTLSLNGRALTVRHAGTVGTAGRLVISSDGRLTVASGATMTVTGAFELSQGVLTNGGRLIIAAGATGTISGGVTKYIDGVLENRGTLTYNGSDLRFGRDAQNFPARIENAAGGVFIVDGEGDFSQHNGGPYRVENAGTFIKRGAGTTTAVNNPVVFATTGTVQIESGILQFNHTTSLAGTIAGAGGLSFVGGSHDFGAGLDIDVTSLALSSTSLSIAAGVAPQLTGVNISSSTLSFADSRSLADVTIRNDARLTMQNNGTMTVTGAFELSQGVLTNGGRLIIAAGATGTISSASTKYIDGVLENRGTLTYNGTDLRFGRDAQNLPARIENAAGGVFIVDGEGDFSQHNGGPYRVENAGTFIKRGAGTTTAVNNPVVFATTGTVQIESGILQFNHTTSLAGTIAGAGGLSFVGGSHDFGAGLDIDVTSLALSSTSLSIAAGVAPQLTGVNISSSTLSFADSRSLADVTIRNDARLTMQNNGTMTVTGAFELSQGVLTNGGRLIIAAGATGTISSASTKYIDGVLENRGTLTYNGTDLRFGRDAQNLPARIENAAGGVFIVDGEGDFSQHNGGPYRVENAGTFIKRGAGTTTAVNNPVVFATTGTVQIESGILQFNHTTSLAGTIAGAGGLSFVGGSHDFGAGLDIDVTSLALSSTSLSIAAGVAPQLTGVNISSSTLSFADSRSLADVTIRNDARLTMQNNGTMTVTGAFELSQGVFTNGGRLIIAAGATGTISSASTKYIDGVLENRGTLTYNGTDLRFGRDAQNLPARIENAAGGVFIVDGEGDFSQHNSGPFRVENAGTFIKRGAGTTTAVNNPVVFATTGTIRMETGTLQLSNALTNDGTLSGTGMLIAGITNNGIVRPDSTPGGLNIQGTYTQSATGRLELTLKGADATLGHRSLTISGSATLDGALDLTLASPFSQLQNTTFSVVGFASRTGDFTTVTGLTNNFGYTFSRSFTATALNLTVDVRGDVPTPPGGLESGFAHWMAQAAQDAKRGDGLGRDDDPDGDGATNLMEYASGTKPYNPASRPAVIPGVAEENGARFAILEFVERQDTTTLRYSIEQSRDLRSWTPVEDVVEFSRCPVIGQPLHSVQLALWPPLKGNTQSFLRLKIEER